MADSITDVRLLARDVLRVVFSTSIAVDSTLMDEQSWTVTPVTAGASQVSVAQVMIDSSFSSVSFVDLKVTRSTVGDTYQVSASGLSKTDGSATIPGDLTAKFVSHLTKVDSILRSMPTMYGSGVGSIVRQILTAIAIQDEEIGGESSVILPTG